MWTWTLWETGTCRASHRLASSMLVPVFDGTFSSCNKFLMKHSSDARDISQLAPHGLNNLDEQHQLLSDVDGLPADVYE